MGVGRGRDAGIVAASRWVLGIRGRGRLADNVS